VPLGLAREADVNVGFHLDLPVILLGAAACLVLLVIRSLYPAFRASRVAYDEGNRHPSRTADAMARASMPATSVAGVRMALDPGRGRTAVPVRTAIAGTVVAVAVLTASVAFGSSLDRLGSTPRLQGWTWDVSVGNPHSNDVSATAIPTLRKDPYVGGFSSEEFNDVAVDGRLVTVIGLDQIQGSVGPPLIEGRAPRGSDEVVFGSKVLTALHKRVGDAVVIAGPLGRRSMRIVGRALITPIIMNGQTVLGDGGWMDQRALQTFVPKSDSDQGAVNVFLVKLAARVNRVAALASLREDFPGTVLTPYAPAEVENLRRIDTLPYVLALLLGVLAFATIAHALITSVRRRRKDLAILKTLGFVRGQVAAAVGWQATTLAVLAAAVGLIAGVIGGRWLWIFFGDRLGIQPEPAIPLLLLIVVIPAALLIANVVAAVPARAAARTEPALVLRAE
jgi:ABC-type antimicrobial peptide transport system permease subunit